MKLLKAVGLIVGSAAVFVVAGLIAFLMVWAALSALFLISRYSERVFLFAGWSWPQFLATIAAAFGIPYVFLLLSPGF